MSKKKRVIGVVSIGLILVMLVSVFFIFRRNSVDFDIAGVSERDCIPYNIFIMKGAEDFSVDIKWSTKAECVGFLLYGKDRGKLDSVAIDQLNSSKSKEHVVTLEKLLTTERYYFLINSQEEAYGNDGVPLEFVLAEL